MIHTSKQHVSLSMTRLAFAIFCVALICGCERNEPRNANAAPEKSVASNDAPVASSVASNLVFQIASLNVTNGALTAEQITNWKRATKDLQTNGAAALPAIHDFLARNVDVNFQFDGNEQSLGAPSLRTALLEIAEQIDGPAAVGFFTNVMQTSADPREIAMAVRFLDRVEPEKHRDAALTAARETLALATTEAWDGRDVAPLFEVIKKFGGQREAVELEHFANSWFNYIAITLAQMTNDAGVPSLIRLAENANGNVRLGRDVYQRTLAQAAVTDTNAANALVELTKRNVIDVGTWPGIGSALAGSKLRISSAILEPRSTEVAIPEMKIFHVGVGNQNFIELPPPETMNSQEIGQRLRLVDKLLESTSNPAAMDALDRARISLAKRLPPSK